MWVPWTSHDAVGHKFMHFMVALREIPIVLQGVCEQNWSRVSACNVIFVGGRVARIFIPYELAEGNALSSGSPQNFCPCKGRAIVRVIRGS